jgi:hypothetical protein
VDDSGLAPAEELNRTGGAGLLAADLHVGGLPVTAVINLLMLTSEPFTLFDAGGPLWSGVGPAWGRAGW